MAITTYSELKTAIADFLARDDLTNEIDTFIDLAESRISRELETRSQDTRTTLTTTADNAYVSLPSDMRTIRNVKIMNNPRVTLRFLSPLQVKKEYANNLLRKDYFELLPFVNMGHAFNKLGYNFFDENLIPQIGINSKHASYFKLEDIKYYSVPTPFTELFFKTTMEQGWAYPGHA